MIHLKVAEIVKAAKGAIVRGDPEKVVTAISTDTRTLKPGELFIALKGPNFDGGKFAEKALEMGAGGIFASEIPASVVFPEDRYYIRVKDAEKALGDIAALWRTKTAPMVIGVIGSSGKTTTKNMTAFAASSNYHVVATEGNHNNTIGAPLTIFRVGTESDMLVIELGMNMPGEMKRLADIADPDFLVVTNIGRAHLGMFDSHASLIRAKAEALGEIRPECVLIINADCPHTPRFLKHAKHNHSIIRYGTGEDAEIRARDIVPSKEHPGYDFELEMRGTSCGRFHVPVYGKYNVYNALATAAVLSAAGMDIQSVMNELKNFAPSGMRSEVFKDGGVTVISDCYNANPESTEAALKSLQDLEISGNVHAVIGDMLELGRDSRRLHEEAGGQAAESGLSTLVTIGNDSRHASGRAAEEGVTSFHADTHEEAADILCNRVKPGDAVLLKGSRLMKLEKVSEILMEKLSKNEVVKGKSE